MAVLPTKPLITVERVGERAIAAQPHRPQFRRPRAGQDAARIRIDHVS